MLARPVTLDGTPEATRPLRTCSRCGRQSEPHGGVELAPGRWHCHSCWRRPILARAAKKSTARK